MVCRICATLLSMIFIPNEWVLLWKIQPVTSHDELQLWDNGILQTDTPQGLLNCVFFYNSKKTFVSEEAKNTVIIIVQ